MSEYRIKYNRTSIHIAGIGTRSRGSELDYATTTCPALSRGAARMANGQPGEDLTEILTAARHKARTSGRRMCAHCDSAAETVLNRPEGDPT